MTEDKAPLAGELSPGDREVQPCPVQLLKEWPDTGNTSGRRGDIPTEASLSGLDASSWWKPSGSLGASMELISFEKKERVGLLRINRPKALNALNQALLEELEGFLSSGIKSEEVRALVVTGEGKAFIAGADIKEMLALDEAGVQAFCALGHKVTRLLETLQMVTIAAVNGFALGGGLELALACDFIYASNQAKLGQPEVTLGIIPGFGGTQRLSRAVGTRLAKELITTGRFLDAEEALRIGLVNKVVEPDKLLDEALDTAVKITQNSFSAVTKAKGAINAGADLPLEQALELEKKNFVNCFTTKDQAEGMAAFIEKRKPSFE